MINPSDLGEMRALDFLPPLALMEAWRNQGLTPLDIRVRVDEYQKLIIENIFNKTEIGNTKPNGFRLNKRVGPPIPKSDLESLCQKHTLGEVGRIYGVSKGTIRAWLAVYGLSKRQINKSKKADQ